MMKASFLFPCNMLLLLFATELDLVTWIESLCMLCFQENKGIETTETTPALEQVDPTVDMSLKSVMSNGVAQVEADDHLATLDSTERHEHDQHTENSKELNAANKCKHDTLDAEKEVGAGQKPGKCKCHDSETSQQRQRKCKRPLEQDNAYEIEDLTRRVQNLEDQVKIVTLLNVVFLCISVVVLRLSLI